MTRAVELLKDLILLALVLILLLQSSYILLLDGWYPGNTGVGSALSMLMYDLRQGPMGGARPSEISGRELWPSGVVLLRQEGDGRLPFRSESEVPVVNAALALAVRLIQEGQPFFSADRFDALLLGEGLLIDLGRTLPLDVVLALLGESGGSRRQTRTLLLTPTEDGLTLVIDGDELLCYTLKGSEITAAYQDCCARIAAHPSYTPVGITGRDAETAALRPGLLYAAAGSLHQTAVSSNALFGEDGQPAASLVQTALPAFSYDVGTPRRDVDADGTIVYVENYSSLRLSPDGLLTYEASQTRHGLPVSRLLGGERESYRVQEIILAGYALIDSAWPEARDLPGAGLRYSGALYSERDGSLTLHYDYVLDGLTIEPEGYPHAVTLNYRNGYFVEAAILLRRYEVAGSLRLADFVRQHRMAALVSGITPTWVELHYRDPMDGSLLLPSYQFGLRPDGEESAAGEAGTAGATEEEPADGTAGASESAPAVSAAY
ncbi:MAG: hypothetical protein IJF59_06295 [Clostridia bacterium]|nr:hypothetical protein [Clostridia bacterium]